MKIQDNRTLLMVCVAGLLMSLLGYLLYLRKDVWNYATDLGLTIFGIASLILLLQNGTFLKQKKYVRIILMLSSLLLIGAVMKIMHWKYGTLLLIISVAAIPLVYFHHFFRKRNKIFTDYLKLIFVITNYIGAIFKLQHYLHADQLLWIASITYNLLLIVFVAGNYRRLITS